MKNPSDLEVRDVCWVDEVDILKSRIRQVIAIVKPVEIIGRRAIRGWCPHQQQITANQQTG